MDHHGAVSYTMITDVAGVRLGSIRGEPGQTGLVGVSQGCQSPRPGDSRSFAYAGWFVLRLHFKVSQC